MGADQPRWYQIGNRAQRLKDVEGWTDQLLTADYDKAPIPPPSTHTPSVPCGATMVARSEILVSGSTATLQGTLTNETGCDVYFSGRPPYAITLDTDGSEHVLLGDFNSPPQGLPSCGDWVMHPGAVIPYRSLPVSLHNPDPRWDGTAWCASSQSTTMGVTTCCTRLDVRQSCSQCGLRTIQLIS